MTELPCYTCIPIFLGRRGTPDPTGQLVLIKLRCNSGVHVDLCTEYTGRKQSVND